jgi:predicted  nucleic acid-binding Zn-ribbon protein
MIASFRFGLIIPVILFTFLSGDSSKENNASCRGKRLYQLQQMNPEFNRVIEQSYWDIKLYNWSYFLLVAPAKEHLKKMKYNRSALQLTIEAIDTSLAQVQSELSLLKEKKIKLDSIKLDAVTFLLTPWILGAAALQEMEISKLEKELTIMEETRIELCSIINDLSKIIHKFG